MVCQLFICLFGQVSYMAIVGIDTWKFTSPDSLMFFSINALAISAVPEPVHQLVAPVACLRYESLAVEGAASHHGGWA